MFYLSSLSSFFFFLRFFFSRNRGDSWRSCIFWPRVDLIHLEEALEHVAIEGIVLLGHAIRLRTLTVHLRSHLRTNIARLDQGHGDL